MAARLAGTGLGIFGYGKVCCAYSTARGARRLRGTSAEGRCWRAGGTSVARGRRKGEEADLLTCTISC